MKQYTSPFAVKYFCSLGSTLFMEGFKEAAHTLFPLVVEMLTAYCVAFTLGCRSQAYVLPVRPPQWHWRFSSITPVDPVELVFRACTAGPVKPLRLEM